MAEQIKYFEDKSKGIVNRDLFTKVAESWVDEIAKSGKISLTQIRKFFDEVLKRKIAIETGASTFDRELPYILMLKAKVTYARARGNVNEAFKKFIENSLSAIKDKNDFWVFVDFFESVIAYSKARPEFKR